MLKLTKIPSQTVELYKISEDDKTVEIELDNIEIPYGIEKYMDKYYINILIKNKELIKKFKTIDKSFDEKNEGYIPSLHKNKLNKYLLKTSVPIIKKSIVCKVFHNDNQISIFDINDHQKISKIYIKLNTYWTYNNKSGINWIINKIII